MDTSAATGKMHAPGSGGVPEKRPAPGGEKRMTKLLHGNEKNRLNGGREPLFSQKELLVLAVPLLVEQLLEVTVGMADTMMVSRCGSAGGGRSAGKGVSCRQLFLKNNPKIPYTEVMCTGSFILQKGDGQAMATVTFSAAGETLYAYLAGEIDHDAAQSLRMQLDDALVSRSPRTLIIDLGGVGFMDSSGIGLILGRQRCARVLGTSLRLQHAPAQLQKVLRLAGIPCTENIEKENAQ